MKKIARKLGVRHSKYLSLLSDNRQEQLIDAIQAYRQHPADREKGIICLSDKPKEYGLTRLWSAKGRELGDGFGGSSEYTPNYLCHITDSKTGNTVYCHLHPTHTMWSRRDRLLLGLLTVVTAGIAFTNAALYLLI